MCQLLTSYVVISSYDNPVILQSCVTHIHNCPGLHLDNDEERFSIYGLEVIHDSGGSMVMVYTFECI